MSTLNSVKDFYNIAQKQGFSKKYNFKVSNIVNAPVTFEEKDLLYLQTASLPARGTNTTNVPYRAFEFVVPTNATFPSQKQWRVTFFSDNKQYIRSLFESWSDAMYNPFNNQSKAIAGDNAFINCRLDLQLFNEGVEVVNDLVASEKVAIAKTYQFFGVFPILLEGVEYDISNTGTEIAKLPVVLAFQYFKIKS